MGAPASGSPGSSATLAVTSPAFADGAPLPPRHSLRGGDLSPPLAWDPPPPGTRSLAVTCFDPDAPGGGFWHWAVAGLPPGTSALPEGAGAPDGSGLPAGAVQARNDFGRVGYGGAAPPRGHGPHRYVFTVHALDTAKPSTGPSASAQDVADALGAHVVARGSVTAVFETR